MASGTREERKGKQRAWGGLIHRRKTQEGKGTACGATLLEASWVQMLGPLPAHGEQKHDPELPNAPRAERPLSSQRRDHEDKNALISIG